jgi:hypothetical protein
MSRRGLVIRGTALGRAIMGAFGALPRDKGGSGG